MKLEDIDITGKEKEILESKELISVEAFLRKEPLHYYDFSKVYSLYQENEDLMDMIQAKKEIAIIGRCLDGVTQSFKNKRCLIKMRVKEAYSGNYLFVNIIGQYKNYKLYKSYENKDILIGGYLNYNEEYHSFSMLNPLLITPEIRENIKLHATYGSMKNIPEEYLEEKRQLGLEKLGTLDFLPQEILKRYHLPSFKESAQMMHYPHSAEEIEQAKKRSVFEDLIYLATKLELQKRKETKYPGIKMEQTQKSESYIQSLPYPLTADQEKVIHTLKERMITGERVNSLVQGDVGTGKTTVAISLLIQAAENGYQAILVAPYTTLASQHYLEVKEICDKLELSCVLLTSDMKAAEKRAILKKISSGEISIIVGTHSIFSKQVEFQKLGLIITDEEHKFGVIHRDEMKAKAVQGFHQITMSATPIPRSLAETMYGNQIDVMTILTKPANRIPIQTAICQKDSTALNFLLKEIQNGHQAYIVCPSIEKNERTTSITEKEPIYRDFFEKQGYKVAVLTGKTKKEEKDILMEQFRNNQIQILIATTVIEVGINNPNATCIVITGADRFGFSTLHQLRGRVGRGNLKSYCILQTDATNEKLQFMTEETDGFKIALKDLELRGPGSLYGNKQSGNDYYVKLMLAYPKMYQKVKQIAELLCNTNNGKEIIERYESLFVTC